VANPPGAKAQLAKYFDWTRIPIQRNNNGRIEFKKKRKKEREKKETNYIVSSSNNTQHKPERATALLK